MNSPIKSVIGVLALLFLLAVPSFAQYGDHITYAQVESLHNFYVGHSRDEPAPIYAAFFYADGLTMFQDGTYRLDSDTNSSGQPWSSSQEDLYWEVLHAGTGDIGIAIEAALGLLTPDELARARDPFANGPNALSTYYTGFFDWSSVGGGDGGGDHDGT